MNKFRFRAESLNDVVNFLFTEVGGIPMKRTSIEFDEKLPDVDCEIETMASLAEVKDNLRGCDHGHVMVQTVSPSETYTGKRNYDER